MTTAHLPTLPELLALTTCAKLGAATAAAEALGLSRAALNRSLTALELKLGAPLYETVRQEFVLTPAGRAYLPEAEAVLDQLNRAGYRAMASGSDAVIRLCCLPGLAESWLIPQLARYRQIAPQVSFEVLNEGAADLIIATIDSAPSRKAEVLMAENLTPIASPALARQIRFETENRSPQEQDLALSRYPLIQQAERPELWQDWFAEAEIAPQIAGRGVRLGSFAMALRAVREGLGLALLPLPLIADDLAEGRVAPISTRPMAGRRYGLICNDAVLAPHISEFRDWLLGEAAKG